MNQHDDRSSVSPASFTSDGLTGGGSILSAAGRQRRNAMLTELLDKQQSWQRHRRARRRAGVGLAMLVVLAGASWTALSWRGSSSNPSELDRDKSLVKNNPNDTSLPAPDETQSPTRIQVIHNADLILADHYAKGTGLIQVVDDAGLVQTLEELGRPAGLIRSEGRVWLTSSVVDQPKDEAPPESHRIEDATTS